MANLEKIYKRLGILVKYKKDARVGGEHDIINTDVSDDGMADYDVKELKNLDWQIGGDSEDWYFFT